MRAFSIFLSVVVFVTNCVLAYSQESNFASQQADFWKERKQRVQLASLPDQKINPISRHVFSEASNTRISKWLKIPSNRHLKDVLTRLPGSYGTIRDVRVPPQKTPKQTLIHIQDVHMNKEAQKNIGAILHELINKDGLHLIALEGAFGPLDLTAFREFPDEDVVHMVADHLFQENKIAGPIRTALKTAQKAPAYVGVDDPVHYEENVKAVKQSFDLKDHNKQLIVDMRRVLDKKKRHVFNPALMAFDQTVQAYRHQQMEWGDYVKALSHYQPALPLAAATFLEALELEAALNFAQVEHERSALLARLLKTLSKPKISELMNMSAAFKMGEIKHADFYEYLRGLCKNNQVPLNRYKAMSAYIHYVLLSSSINAEEFLSGLADHERIIYKQLTRAPEEARLIEKSRRFYLLEQLMDFALTSEQWHEYKNFNISYPEESQLKNKSSFEKFYMEAEARDAAMAKNLINAIDQTQSKVTVLVTGGFHSKGIQKQLAGQDLNIISWVPKISKVNKEDGTNYLSVFTQEKTPLEQIFEGQKLFLSQKAFPADTQKTTAALLLSVGAKIKGLTLEAMRTSAALLGLNVHSITVKSKQVVLNTQEMQIGINFGKQKPAGLPYHTQKNEGMLTLVVNGVLVVVESMAGLFSQISFDGFRQFVQQRNRMVTVVSIVGLTGLLTAFSTVLGIPWWVLVFSVVAGSIVSLPYDTQTETPIGKKEVIKKGVLVAIEINGNQLKVGLVNSHGEIEKISVSSDFILDVNKTNYKDKFVQFIVGEVETLLADSAYVVGVGLRSINIPKTRIHNLDKNKIFTLDDGFDLKDSISMEIKKRGIFDGEISNKSSKRDIVDEIRSYGPGRFSDEPFIVLNLSDSMEAIGWIVDEVRDLGVYQHIRLEDLVKDIQRNIIRTRKERLTEDLNWVNDDPKDFLRLGTIKKAFDHTSSRIQNPTRKAIKKYVSELADIIIEIHEKTPNIIFYLNGFLVEQGLGKYILGELNKELKKRGISGINIVLNQRSENSDLLGTLVSVPFQEGIPQSNFMDTVRKIPLSFVDTDTIRLGDINVYGYEDVFFRNGLKRDQLGTLRFEKVNGQWGVYVDARLSENSNPVPFPYLTMWDENQNVLGYVLGNVIPSKLWAQISQDLMERGISKFTYGPLRPNADSFYSFSGKHYSMRSLIGRHMFVTMNLTKDGYAVYKAESVNSLPKKVLRFLQLRIPDPNGEDTIISLDRGDVNAVVYGDKPLKEELKNIPRAFLDNVPIGASYIESSSYNGKINILGLGIRFHTSSEFSGRYARIELNFGVPVKVEIISDTPNSRTAIFRKPLLMKDGKPIDTVEVISRDRLRRFEKISIKGFGSNWSITPGKVIGSHSGDESDSYELYFEGDQLVKVVDNAGTNIPLDTLSTRQTGKQAESIVELVGFLEAPSERSPPDVFEVDLNTKNEVYIPIGRSGLGLHVPQSLRASKLWLKSWSQNGKAFIQIQAKKGDTQGLIYEIQPHPSGRYRYLKSKNQERKGSITLAVNIILFIMSGSFGYMVSVPGQASNSLDSLSAAIQQHVQPVLLILFAPSQYLSPFVIPFLVISFLSMALLKMTSPKKSRISMKEIVFLPLLVGAFALAYRSSGNPYPVVIFGTVVLSFLAGQLFEFYQSDGKKGVAVSALLSDAFFLGTMFVFMGNAVGSIATVIYILTFLPFFPTLAKSGLPSSGYMRYISALILWFFLTLLAFTSHYEAQHISKSIKEFLRRDNIVEARQHADRIRPDRKREDVHVFIDDFIRYEGKNMQSPDEFKEAQDAIKQNRDPKFVEIVLDEIDRDIMKRIDLILEEGQRDDVVQLWSYHALLQNPEHKTQVAKEINHRLKAKISHIMRTGTWTEDRDKVRAYFNTIRNKNFRDAYPNQVRIIVINHLRAKNFERAAEAMRFLELYEQAQSTRERSMLTLLLN